MTDHPYTIVVLGACNSGKSSIINTVTKTDKCQISKDGKPTTLEIKCVSAGDRVYIDTPGLGKSPSKRLELPFGKKYSPSLIWLVVNFQAAIEDDEFQILEANPNIPAIIIVNKVDVLKNEEDTETFDDMNYSTNNRNLTAVHKRLMNMKEANANIRHAVIMSLKDENNDRWIPIGIPSLEKMTDLQLSKANKSMIPYEPIVANKQIGSNLTIVISGYSSGGKSSLINAILRDSKAAMVGYDGGLTTPDWKCYKVGQLTLWDSPAVNKRSSEQQNLVPRDPLVQPDIIWFIWNYTTSDIEDEHHVHSLFGFDTKIPVIVVMNKVDNLRKIPHLSENEIVQFSRQSPDCSLSARKKFPQLRDQIINKWSTLMNLTAVTVTSLYNEDGDDENPKPIGVEALLDITREHLASDSQRRVLDVLKEDHIQYTTSDDQLQESKF
jgi:GTPase Era involved in 16S rRNA processing